MSDMTTKVAASVEVTGVVVRCGCTDTEKQDPNWHAFKDEVCPRPREIVDLGVMNYYNKNPFKLAWWHVKRLFTDK